MTDEEILEQMVDQERDSIDFRDLPPKKLYVFPTLQFNVVGMREDELTFLNMLKFFEQTGNISGIKLATGYLNL